MTPAGTSIDVQNGWEENTTHTQHSVGLLWYSKTNTSVAVLKTVFVCVTSSRDDAKNGRFDHIVRLKFSLRCFVLYKSLIVDNRERYHV